jgi:hypothetical protein
VRDQQGDAFDDLPDYDDEDESNQFPPAPHDFSVSLERTAALPPEHTVGDGLASQKVKPQSSFSALKSKGKLTSLHLPQNLNLMHFPGSRLFRGKNSDKDNSAPPPPPVPQIPIDVTEPKTRAPVLTPAHNSRSSLATSRTSLTKPKDHSLSNSQQDRIISISRPTFMSQIANPPIPENHTTVPFTKRAGPPSARPARPDSLDEETLAFMRETGTRMVLPSTPRASAPSTPRSHTISIEARLGFPSGFANNTTSRSCSLESPLAAHFSGQRLPVRDSSGSVRYSRFSEFVKYAAGKNGGRGAAVDREVGLIEVYRESKEGDWVLEKRVSRKDGVVGGMLFRDRWGGFHFVGDI